MAMVEASTHVEIFCSYAHADEVWLQKLQAHLSLLKWQGLISLWYDRLIAPGTDWARTIDMHLETASIILLLVSADFFASDYCYGIELKRALERQAAGEVRVLPILVRPVDWNGASLPISKLYPLTPDQLYPGKTKMPRSLILPPVSIERLLRNCHGFLSTHPMQLCLPSGTFLEYTLKLRLVAPLSDQEKTFTDSHSEQSDNSEEMSA